MKLKTITQADRDRLFDTVANVFRFAKANFSDQINRRTPRVRHCSAILEERRMYKWWRRETDLPDRQLIDELHAIYGKSQRALNDFLNDLFERRPECEYFRVVEDPKHGFGKMIPKHDSQGNLLFYLNIPKTPDP